MAQNRINKLELTWIDKDKETPALEPLFFILRQDKTRRVINGTSSLPTRTHHAFHIPLPHYDFFYNFVIRYALAQTQTDNVSNYLYSPHKGIFL